MPVKFFCDNCGKEIFQGMDQNTKETTTIAEIEQECLCSDCEHKKVKEK